MVLKINPKKISKTQIGNLGEIKAVKYLTQKGFKIVDQNFYYQHGEIDIIAKDKTELVFVEVKFRTQDKFGAPEESVTPKKQELLRRTAEGYLYKNNLNDISCRFDVISILSKNKRTTFQHFINAF